MKQKLYWIWLSQAMGIACPAAQTVVERQLDPQEIYRLSLEQLIQTEWFPPALCKKLKSFPLQKAEKIYDRCQKQGYTIITIEDPYYPRQLLALPDPPLVLYAQGNIPLLGHMENMPVITVVGTRNASAYGIRAAGDLTRGLAEMGLVIVSGLAPGIDACAHQAALSVRGKTVAVLGCGLDHLYPAMTTNLREWIVRQGGTVLTELSPSTEVNGRYFPVRNRLLAGLSQGVLVVEAPARSGALITASCALEQGKDVFAVPFDIYDKNGAGTLGLIRDGAIPAISVQDVAYPYAVRLSGQLYSQLQKEKNNLPKNKINSQKTVREKEKCQPAPEQKKPKTQREESLLDIPNLQKRDLDINSVDWQQEKAELLSEFLHDTAQTPKQPQQIERQEHSQQRKKPENEEVSPKPVLKTISQEPAKAAPLTIDQAKPKENRNDPMEEMTDQQKKVYALLTKQPQTLEELARRSQMNVGELTSILFEIGVPDPIKVYPGRRFSLI